MFKKVIWATDGSTAADRALEVAEQIATDGGELLAVHCVELTVPGKTGGRLPVYANEDELTEKIEGQLSDLAADGVRTRIRIERGDVGEAAQVLADIAREEGSEVIIVGTRGRGPFTGLLLGSVTQRLMHLAPCPVLAVPARDSDGS